MEGETQRSNREQLEIFNGRLIEAYRAQKQEEKKETPVDQNRIKWLNLQISKLEEENGSD